jgi:hypothetical protein
MRLFVELAYVRAPSGVTATPRTAPVFIQAPR